MTERQLVQKLLLAFQADEDVQESVQALDAGVADRSEVGDDAARAAAVWQTVERNVKEFEREAQKRMLEHLSPPKRVA